MTENKRLEVFYHDEPVGSLVQTPDERVAFQYSSYWLQNGFSISPFSLPLRDQVFIPKPASRETSRGLFGIFADSLPDAWGELLLDRYLASLGIQAQDLSVLDRLAYSGDTGIGALEYRPARKTEYTADGAAMDYDEIARECRRLLSSRTSERLDELYQLAGSSGGTRPKILVREDGRDWIVKFPAAADDADAGKREYEYSLCAKRCGILMTETRLLPSQNNAGYFQIERFDRNKDGKIMTATFAALLEADYRAPSCDYTTYMKLIRILTRENLADVEQMYRLMSFNVLAHNRDDHTKNFTFLYTKERGWRLAPAYDLTFSNTWFGEQTTSVNNKGKNITDEDMIKVGTDAGLSKNRCREILDQIHFETEKLIRQNPDSASGDSGSKMGNGKGEKE